MSDDQALYKAIRDIESAVGDPSCGLPEDVFLFASRLTPLVNVDLLIKNEHGQTLLTWRDDGYCKAGWHVPGGIIRYKEKIESRITAVAKSELGTGVRFDPAPLAVNELFHPSRRTRGHFISLLFQCRLTAPPDEALRCTSSSPSPGQWLWHSACPDNLIEVHEVYRQYI